MDDPPPLVHGVRPGRTAPGGGVAALQRRLDATRDALAEETRRREVAHAAWTEERRAHAATRAELVLAEERAQALTAAATAVARAARQVLAAREPAATLPHGEPVARRLAAVLDVVAAPGAAGERPDPEELGRRFALVRSQLAGAAR